MEIATILTSYAISHVVAYSDGPFDLFANLRKLNPSLFGCVPCLSFYVTGMVSFVSGVSIMWWLASWGAVIMIDKLILDYMVK